MRLKSATGIVAQFGVPAFIVIGKHLVESAAEVFCFVRASRAVVEPQDAGNLLVAEAFVKSENGFDPIRLSLVSPRAVRFFKNVPLLFGQSKLEHTPYFLVP